MIRLTTQQVKMLHRDVIAQSGGSPEIRDGCTGLVRSSRFLWEIPVGTGCAVSEFIVLQICMENAFWNRWTRHAVSLHCSGEKGNL